MLKLTDYIGLGNAEYSDTLIGLRLSTRLHIGGKAGPSYIDVLLSGVSPLALTNALGLNYIKALGATEQNGTPTPSNPVDIVCNNGVLKIKNLFDGQFEQTGYYITANGVISRTSSNEAGYTYLIQVLPNTTYTFSSTVTAFISGTNKRIHAYDTNGDWIEQVGIASEPSGYYTITFTTPSNCKYVRVSMCTTETEAQLEQGSTATSYIPYGEVYADGTQETVTVVKNLFDKNTVVSNYRLSNRLNKKYSVSDDFAGATGSFVSALIPVEVGKTYYKNAPSEDAYHRYKTYNANQVGVRIVDENTVTIQEGEAYIAFCGYLSELDDTILYDTTDTQTANAEMLLEVGNNRDNQELLTGNITRNVGIKVFNGTENWIKTSASRKYCSLSKIELPNVITTSSDIICSHAIGTGYDVQGYCYLGNSYFNFNYLNATDDLDDFKQFLADQYANGTPVIIVYPLATPTTETVSGQTLTASGNCTVTATGSLDNLELELSYKQGVTVRVREASNESLDNQVNVTIS